MAFFFFFYLGWLVGWFLRVFYRTEIYRGSGCNLNCVCTCRREGSYNYNSSRVSAHNTYTFDSLLLLFFFKKKEMARRPSFTLVALAVALTVFFVFVLSPTVRESAPAVRLSNAVSSAQQQQKQPTATTKSDVTVNDIKSQPFVAQHDVISGAPIMAKMGNETIRAELGRAAWKVFHTILAQYPEHPTDHDRQTLTSYIHLFSRVYPCRECAEHFQVLLKRYPPQVSSREHASQWGCHVHNQVNKRLGKEIFDCNEISDKYNCGCGDEEETPSPSSTPLKNKLHIDQKDDLTKGG